MDLDSSAAARTFAELVQGIGLPVLSTGLAGEPDLVLLDAGGHHVLVQVKHAPSPIPTRMPEPVPSGGRGSRTDALQVLVADRISAAARAELNRRGWGWLDLRGHLHIAGHGVFIDAEVPPITARTRRGDPLSGAVGLEVACTLLLDPAAGHGVRDLARRLSRSPSTVSEVLGAFREQRLVTREGGAAIPDLFWEAASAWKSDEVHLAEHPRLGDGSVNAALRLGSDVGESQPGWALTGTLAASIYGAPVAAKSDFPPDFYVPDPDTVRRATRLLGVAADAAHRRASIRAAPVAMVCAQRVDPTSGMARVWSQASEPWLLAKPLFVALDLALDPGRGREILDGWTPPAPWQRVW